MTDQQSNRGLPARGADRAGATIPTGLFAVSTIAVLALAGIGARHWARGDFNLIHALLSLFFSINLVICYWEICLFLKRDFIEKRAEYWGDRRRETGRSPVVEFIAGRVALPRILSPAHWADVWATYSQYDGSYADRRTYGFNVDIANGFATPIPTLILYAAYTLDLMPALAAGIIGAMLFWQLTYMTSVYWVSFFVADRQARISRREKYIYIYALNCPWVLFALLGLYVSIRLIADGDYSVLGYRS